MYIFFFEKNLPTSQTKITQPLKKNTKKITQLVQNCIGPTIRIGGESWCLPYAGFFTLNCTNTTTGSLQD